MLKSAFIVVLFAGSGAWAADAGSVATPLPTTRHPGQNGDLTLEQDKMAQAAWKYFDNNFQPSTCLYNSADQYPSTTLWDTSSSIAGLVAAFELNILYPWQFDEKISCLLGSLARLPLYHDELPNKAYNAIDLTMVDYNNKPGELGFSAIDVGRLLTWLAIVKQRYPAHADEVDAVVLRWKFCNVLDRDGTMYGASTDPDGGVRYLQEGRLGYEEYAAQGFQLWGFGTDLASREEPYGQIGIFGVPISYDARDAATYGGHNYVVTEPWLLRGLELGWDEVGDTNPSDAVQSDRPALVEARRIYEVQERRWRRTGILTARSEHQLDGPPWFVYDTIYSDGTPWTTISDTGQTFPEFAAVSTKAAVGLWILFDTPYTEALAQAVEPLVDPERGVYEGIYEGDGRKIGALTANTNGIVLESLLYRKEGKLLRDNHVSTQWDQLPTHDHTGGWQCLPLHHPWQ